MVLNILMGISIFAIIIAMSIIVFPEESLAEKVGRDIALLRQEIEELKNNKE